MVSVTTKAPAAIDCPYCHQRARFLLSSESVYHGRDYGPVYVCPGNCDARVGAHRDSLQPMGRMADAKLRARKTALHALFDPLWRDLEDAYPEMPVIPRWIRKKARSRAYLWLAHHMKIKPDECHIGKFDLDTCERAVYVIDKYKPTSAVVRAWIKEFDKEPTQ